MTSTDRQFQAMWCVALLVGCFILTLVQIFHGQDIQRQLQDTRLAIKAAQQRNQVLEGEYSALTGQQRLAELNQEYGFIAPAETQYVQNERQLAAWTIPEGNAAPPISLASAADAPSVSASPGYAAPVPAKVFPTLVAAVSSHASANPAIVELTHRDDQHAGHPHRAVGRLDDQDRLVAKNHGKIEALEHDDGSQKGHHALGDATRSSAKPGSPAFVPKSAKVPLARRVAADKPERKSAPAKPLATPFGHHHGLSPSAKLALAKLASDRPARHRSEHASSDHSRVVPTKRAPAKPDHATSGPALARKPPVKGEHPGKAPQSGKAAQLGKAQPIAHRAGGRAVVRPSR